MKTLRQSLSDLRGKRDESNDDQEHSVDVVPGFDIIPNAKEERPARVGSKVTFKRGGN